MRPITHGKDALHSDMMSLQRIIRRAEQNSTRPKERNQALIGHIREALRLMLLDDAKASKKAETA